MPRMSVQIAQMGIYSVEWVGKKVHTVLRTEYKV